MSDSEKPSLGDSGEGGASDAPPRPPTVSVGAACSALITTGHTADGSPAQSPVVTLLGRRANGDGEADSEEDARAVVDRTVGLASVGRGDGETFEKRGDDHMSEEDGLSARSNSDRRWAERHSSSDEERQVSGGSIGCYVLVPRGDLCWHTLLEADCC